MDLRDQPTEAFIESLRRRFPTERETDELLTRKMRRRAGPPYRQVTMDELVGWLNAMLAECVQGPFQVHDPRWLTGGGEVTEARGDHDVFGDGKVIMVNLPGHTPGHHGLLVRLASGPVLLSGDTYHFAEQVTHRGVPPFNTNRAESLASMDRFDRLGRNLHAVVIIQHEPADVAKLPAFPASAR